MSYYGMGPDVYVPCLNVGNIVLTKMESMSYL